MIRLVLLSLAILSCSELTAQTPAASPTEPVRRVVFVCEHGSVDSLIAATYFNRAAQKRGLPFEAVARGTAPQPTVPRAVQAGLHEIGIDVSHYVPRLFQPADVSGASLVVSFDQDVTGVVGGRAPQLRWDNTPSVLADYSRGRDAIVAKVDALLDRLAKDQGAGL